MNKKIVQEEQEFIFAHKSHGPALLPYLNNQFQGILWIHDLEKIQRSQYYAELNYFLDGLLTYEEKNKYKKLPPAISNTASVTNPNKYLDYYYLNINQFPFLITVSKWNPKALLQQIKKLKETFLSIYQKNLLNSEIEQFNILVLIETHEAQARNTVSNIIAQAVDHSSRPLLLNFITFSKI